MENLVHFHCFGAHGTLVFLFSYLSSILNYEDKQPIVAAHTLFEPLFGSHFGVLLDISKTEFQYGVVAFTLTIILLSIA